MLFEFLLAVLLLLALAMIAPSLIKSRSVQELDRSQQNVAIARERLDELAADHASGEMTDEVYQQVRTELEASLLDDVSQTQPAQQPPAESTQQTGNRIGRFSMLALVVLLPVSAMAFYLKLGSPQYLEYHGANAGTMAGMEHMAESMPSIESMIEKLEKQLEDNPDDGNAWFMLAKAYMSQDVFDKALAALEKAYAIFGNEPAILLGMADAAAMLNEGDLTGKPTEYIDKALEIDPQNTTGLWLGGMSAQQNGQFDLAVRRWLVLMPLVRDEAESMQQLKSLIGQAIEQSQAAGTPVDIEAIIAELEGQRPQVVEQMPSASEAEAAAADGSADQADGSVAVKAWVSLDPALQSQVAPQDTLFVFAKAEAGPPMPLAAFKGSVADLPLEVTLDDSMAMMPQMKISAFPRVKVSARIARGGTPTVQSGDITSAEQVVDLQGTVAVELILNSVVE